jgi:hypothetical protein
MTTQWNPPTNVVDQNAQSIQWLSYVDLENDVLPWAQIPDSEITTAQKANMQLLIDMTCTWAQRKLGQPIAPTTFSRRFDGWSGWTGAYIMLPYTPVLEIKTVIEYWGVSGPHYLSEQTFTNQIDGFQCTYQTGMMTRVFPGLVQKPWFPGSKNIAIEWVAGWNPLPPDWKVATLEMIVHWWRNVFQQSANELGGAGTGDSYDPEAVANGLWQGTPLRIANLLDSSVHVGMG